MRHRFPTVLALVSAVVSAVSFLAAPAGAATNVGSTPADASAAGKACDLRIVKTMSPAPLVSGGSATITLTVTNLGGKCGPSTVVKDMASPGLSFSGPATATPTVGWNCTLPLGNVKCVNNNALPPGYTVTFTVSAVVGAKPGTIVKNCAGVANPNDANLANNRSCVSLDVVAPKPCDLQIVKTMAPAPLGSGQPATITLTLTNLGGKCGPSTVVSDVAPPGLLLFGPATASPAAGWSCTMPSGNVNCLNNNALPPGYTVTFSFSALVTAKPGAIVNNCAGVKNPNDANLANNRSCVSLDVVAPKPCDLQIAKKMSPTPLVSGGSATITLTLTNLGGLCQPQTVVTDLAPAGLSFSGPASASPAAGWNCTLPSGSVYCVNYNALPPGYTVTFTVSAVVTAQPGTIVSNCAGVNNPSDVNVQNNRSCVALDVVTKKPCDLQIVKTMSPKPLVSGGSATITLTLTNLGGKCGPSTVVKDIAPPGLSFSGPATASPAAGWTCTLPSGNVKCVNNNALPPGYTVTFTVSAVVGAKPGTIVKNCAGVANPNDANLANNRSCVSLDVVAPNKPCDLQIVKTMSPTPLVSGQPVTITLTVTNLGGPCAPGPFPGTVVQDTQPAGLMFTAPPTTNPAAGWSCSLGGSPVVASCGNQSTLPPGYTVTVTINAVVNAQPDTLLTNCGSVANANDTNAANNRSCVSVDVIKG